MRILFAIFVLSFLALVWAAVAITRHIRRGTGTLLAESPATASGPATDPLMPNRAKPGKYPSTQRHDRTFASKNSGNLDDPNPRISTRPRRKGRR